MYNVVQSCKEWPTTFPSPPTHTRLQQQWSPVCIQGSAWSMFFLIVRDAVLYVFTLK